MIADKKMLNLLLSYGWVNDNTQAIGFNLPEAKMFGIRVPFSLLGTLLPVGKFLNHY
jgi:hypothetical protein